MSTRPLNAGQRAAADATLQFLLDPTQKYLIISGPGGTGKTYLMGYLIDEIIPAYSKACQLLGEQPLYTGVYMTATTNKAAEQLGMATGRPAGTIHSHLGLRVKENNRNGDVELIPTDKWRVHKGEIVFVDEGSMVNRELKRYIGEGFSDSKIIYVCDDKQLPPVKEELSAIFNDGTQVLTLTEPMRNAGQPALMALCQQFRDTVDTGVFNDIKLVPGVIDWASDEQMPGILEELFMDAEHSNSIMGYSNARVVDYNDYIRDMRGLPTDTYVVGEKLVNNSMIMIFRGADLDPVALQTEDEIEITAVSPVSHWVDVDRGRHEPVGTVMMEVIGVMIKTAFGVEVAIDIPADMKHFRQLINWYAGKKDWTNMFKLKGKYPDLRPRDARTTHKAQGSSYDVALIDVGNLSTCHQQSLAARLFYVAVSRARHRIIFYGDLAPKYGKFVE